MNCVIRVIAGPDEGLEHKVEPGSHIIGRGSKAALRLTPEDVSWEHALITREADEYFIENLSSQGTWIGEARVAGRVKLRPRDKVRLSGTCEVRLEPAKGEGGMGRGWLALMLLLMVAVAIAVVFFAKGNEGNDDWMAAYRSLEPWAEAQAAHNRLPPEAVALFQRAWRLEQTKDLDHAIPAWTQLQIALAGAEKDLHCLELAGKDSNDRALQNFLTPAPDFTPTEEEKAAAFAQFVRRWLAYGVKQKNHSLLSGV